MQLIQAEFQNALDNYTKKPIGHVKVEKVMMYQKDFEIHVTFHGPNTLPPTMITFENCFINEFPSSHTLCSRFPNLTALRIVNCKLSRIDKDDLRGLHNLTLLAMGCNDIESLPRGLFDHMRNLEIISFRSNKIKVIDKDILNPLKNLKYFNLTGNSVIDVKYDSIWNKGNVTLAQLKEEIKNKCKPPTEIWQIVENQRKEINNLKETIATQGREIDELKKNNEMRNAIQNFIVKINETEFHVEKAILAANSPVLAKMIHADKNAVYLELTDISEKTFEEILDFMLTKKPPNETSKLIELYAASARLEMKELMELTASMLMDKVTKDG